MRTRIALALLSLVLVVLLNSALAWFFHARYAAATEELFSRDLVRIDYANALLVEAERLETTGVRLLRTVQFATLEELFDRLVAHVERLNQTTFELVRGEPSVDSIRLYRATQNVLASANLVFQLRSSHLGAERRGVEPTASDSAALTDMYRQMLADLRELTGLTTAVQEYIYSQSRYKFERVARQHRVWVWISWILAAGALLLALIGGWWYTGRRVIERLAVIRAALTANPAAGGNCELPVHGRDEIAALARSAEEALQASNQLAQQGDQLRDFARSAADWFWEFNREYCFTHLSPAFFEVTGLAPETVIGRSINSLFKDTRVAVPAAVLRKARRYVLRRNAFRDLLMEYRQREDSVRFYRLTGVPRWRDNGDFAGFRGTAIDVTEEILARRRLEVEAVTDPLTGVHNRRRFMELCAQEFARWLRSPRPLCLAILEIDHLKAINDQYGYLERDATLIKFASVARDMVRQADIFGRLGGEEFGLLIPDTDLVAAEVFLQRIRSAARSIDQLPSPPLALNIGVVEINGGDTSVQALLRRADNALRQAKKPDHNRAGNP
ncbi:GGDEF domain-containing protein [Exilibacterium tricleocarpae]|uniref:GGDEF domain-containing protein n=1 Tax=Exilibacterium tricleocarpae TaxID=2591008 RepID=UPI0015D17B3C|nr:sensor domain-containing diguanylate cyclase [Exilibacterium tricleocarpae]